MAQPSPAQREPSMEEILASIRRIIEDSDETRKPAATLAEPPAAEADQVEVEAFRSELAEAPHLPAGGPSMADIQAELARETAALDAADKDVAPVEIEPEMSEPAVVEPAYLAPAEAVRVEPPVFRPRAEAASAVAPARNSILSDVAGRQVAAAFGELTEAFAATRRRSFDEMAEEMMRPMLQDWLDNNLPTLVEKLVREEIERVARGS